jgi:hypothetical protein
VIVRVAVRLVPAAVAVTVAVVVVMTDTVLTVKVALVAPAATVTLAGVDAAAELSLSDTTRPPLGAAALNVTVPVDALPPTTLVGLTATAERVVPVESPGVTVRPVVCCRPVLSPRPEITTPVVEPTAAVFTTKLPLEAPSGTVMEAGTVATAVLLVPS